MKRLLLPLLLLCSTVAQAEKPVAPLHIPGATALSAEQLVELVLATPELVIIDARKEEEFAKGHIENAISLPDTEMSTEVLAVHVAHKQTPLLFYCNGERCLRSTNAAKKALSWGYKSVYWFRGGWVEWREKNLPVEK
ncbi:MAG: rhodanese-like domain-containing protein [Gammaproteobacteria bacterium]|nr:rhodanese-like domain-containing protein [Gammaproteobacteria bacterium]